MKLSQKAVVLNGMQNGLPIGFGYFAVSFSLGVAAQKAGITPLQGFVMSLLNNASAGEYAGIAAIRAQAPYWEIALLILIANARYVLMSTALSQKFSENLPLKDRLFIGFDITDELFGITCARPTPVNPRYVYGAYITTIPFWATGTALGIIAGNILPQMLVCALSASIYGMFLAVVVPPARKDKVVLLVVLASFLLSSLGTLIPWFRGLTESLRIIILTLLLSTAAAIVFPRKEEAEK